jgi:molecular chaperone GrpE
MSDEKNDLHEEHPELAVKLSELEILKQSLDASKAKEKDLYDQLLRSVAEFDNFRKRNESRTIDARNAGREDVLMQVIGLSDILMHAEESSRKATDIEAIKKGLTLVRQQFEKFLTDQQVVPIKSKGEKMNPHLHEAVAQDVRDDAEEGEIVEEIQRGYKLGDRVLRPSRVKVAAKPSGDKPKEN